MSPKSGFDVIHRTYIVVASIQVVVQLLALATPAALLYSSLNDPLTLLFSLLLSYYLYPLGILLFTALAGRLLPKPTPGYISNHRDLARFIMLYALSLFARRSPARWLAHVFPFPGVLYYRLWGSKVSSRASITSADVICDPYAVTIGEGTTIGEGVYIFSHYRPHPTTLLIGEVKIGNGVLIGCDSTIWADVTIGNGAVIQERSSLTPGTVVPPGEVWGGVPAKRLTTFNPNAKLHHDPKEKVRTQATG